METYNTKDLNASFIIRGELTELYHNEKNYASLEKMIVEGIQGVQHLFEHFIKASPKEKRNVIMLTIKTEGETYRLFKYISGAIQLQKI